MAFTERSFFSSKSEHSFTPERGLDQLAEDVSAARSRVDAALSFAQEIQVQLGLWNDILKQTDASLESPDAKMLMKRTVDLHTIYRKAIREFSAAMKDLEALTEAYETITKMNVFGSSEIGEA